MSRRRCTDPGRTAVSGTKRPQDAVDFAALYDRHGEYTARRVAGSFEQAQVLLEATGFKIPHLLGVLPQGHVLTSVLEIGCATGELISNFPVAPGGQRVGCDISPANVRAAAARYPDVQFFAGDFAHMPMVQFDAVVLSDVLEHVDDDAGFLRSAAQRARYTLVNLPLEDNWLNRNRAYGPNDVSGHLRRYSLKQGLALFPRAGLRVLSHRQVWIHETSVDSERRRLREQHFGQAFAGSLPTRWLKQGVVAATRVVRPLGQRLFASNLFALAVKETD